MTHDKRFTLRMPESLYRTLEQEARHLVEADASPTVSEAVRQACVEHVKRSIPPREGVESNGSN